MTPKKTSTPGPAGASSFTVIVLRGMGRIRSFRISSRLAVWSAAFIALYLIASLAAINGYFFELRDRTETGRRMERLEREAAVSKRALLRSEQHVSLLRGYLKQIGRPEAATQPPPAPPAEPEAAPSGPVGSGALPAAQPHAATAPETPPRMLVRDLTLEKAGLELTVRFKLVNPDEDRSPIRGYVHVVALDPASDPPQLWTFPKVALRDGAPVDFQKGYFFVIRNYKTVEAKYFLDHESHSPSLFQVLVYLESGDLLLKEEVRLEAQQRPGLPSSAPLPG